MKNKILGLDLGTNSIGWAVVEEEENQFELVDKGVRIFQEGVKIDKGNESSKAAERTKFRSSRKLKYRRKLRKIAVLQVLSEFGFCPKLTDEELNAWRYNNIYPENIHFRNWWLTDNQQEKGERIKQKKNPYYYRFIAITEKLDLSIEQDRFIIGRAFYHITQRRGFLSNRLESTKESDGAVKKSINELNAIKGNKTLGHFFYEKYIKGEKIRDQYTHRESHYLHEFEKISSFQNLPDEFIHRLRKAIFYQRPLKSQKGLIGKCVFEKNKPRSSVSRPEFEEYRMLCFINNIKVKTPLDDKLRPLKTEERKKIIGQFYRKSKEHFDFEDIAKKIAPKKQYKYYKDRNKHPEDWLFNYTLKTTVSGCPVSARFKEIFEEEFIDENYQYILDTNGNLPKKITDSWHALYTFDSRDKLKVFAVEKLHLNNENAEKFIDINLKHDYSSLSLKAINNILPFLRDGLIYSHAVFLANLENILPQEVWSNSKNKAIIKTEIQNIILNQNEDKQIIDAVNGIIKNTRENGEVWSEEAANIFEKELKENIIAQFGNKKYKDFSEEKKTRIEKESFELLKQQMQKNLGKGEFAIVQRIDELVKQFLSDNFEVKNLDKLYHPSAVDVYKFPVKHANGCLLLNSPMVNSIRNPMAMRTLHQLRKVINELIIEEIIDPNTKINIEMSRGLLNANERAGLQRWQNDNKNKRKEYTQKIKEHFDNNGIKRVPSDDEILKYQLWEEQKHKCLYTGNEISISDFIGNDSKYDIEHTIPRSISLDNSQENKTLCESKFNRSVKKNKIPSELENHNLILARIEHWKKTYEELDIQINKLVKASRGASDKETKDKFIQKRHYLTKEKYYWVNKYQRFIMIDVPAGFKNSQMVDTGIITKYSRMYLNTLFNKVYTVKGNIVADFRRMWGLQEEFERKERINHVHHCIDAVTIACITKMNYEKLAKFYHDWEDNFFARNEHKPQVDKPWRTFTEDVKAIENELFISHYTADILPKPAKKILRKKGKIVCGENGKPLYQTGDSVRGALHKETFYGAIEKEIENKKGEIEKQIKYVVRKSLAVLKKDDVNKIVDEAVKIKVKQAIDDKILIISSSDTAKNKIEKTIWMNEEKKVPINKVRIYQPSVTNPLHIKQQRDKSSKNKKEHKEYFHAANDSNYLMAIYELQDEKGKYIRDFEIRNNLGSAEFFKNSVQKTLKAQEFGKLEGFIPKTKTVKKLELSLKAILKIGTMVILWENSPEEVWDLDIPLINKRLYKVIGLSNQNIKTSSGKQYEYATIVLRFHQEATAASDLKVQDGTFKHNEDYIAQRKMNHNQFNALVEGIDFTISVLGKLKRIK
jgi:CRISPR-associated endonuclease Csn1